MHRRRASRCASTPETDEVTRKGSRPISIRRIGVDGRIVGVQRRQHHVAGEGRLDGDDRRLLVADLTDQDDVRVGAQDGPEGRGEVQAGLEIELDLVDALEAAARPGPRR